MNLKTKTNKMLIKTYELIISKRINNIYEKEFLFNKTKLTSLSKKKVFFK